MMIFTQRSRYLPAVAALARVRADHDWHSRVLANRSYINYFSAASLVVTIVILSVLCGVARAQDQETSLFRQSPPQLLNPIGGSAGQMAPQAPLMAAQSSPLPYPQMMQGSGDVGLASACWTYTPPPQSRSFRIQDIVTIRVDELTRMRADGTAQVRKNTLYDAILKDWIALRKGNLGTDAQSSGDPRVEGQTNQLYRASSTLESHETLAFNVAARVVDIQPNGNLVLEARKTVWVNDNSWETALSGICRAQDITPDNVVLSRDLLDLQVRKNEKGQLRDGYKRGWITRWINEFNPF